MAKKQSVLGAIDHVQARYKKQKRYAGKQFEFNDILYQPDDHTHNATKQSWKYIGLTIVLLCVMISLAARLFELQVVKGAMYNQRALKNKTTRVLQIAPRGVIKDANGSLLAFNKAFIMTGEDQKEVPYSDQDAKEIDPTKITSRRAYPCDEACAHLIGYTSILRAEEAAKQRALNGSIANTKEERGRTGLEQAYQDILKGQDGYVEYEVTAEGTLLREVGVTPQQPGLSLRTSIDSGLQKFIYNALEESIAQTGAKGAAAIVMNPRTGEVKALVSAPAFNNNIFTVEKENADQVEATLKDERLPLLNRATAGIYPPGSTYKLVTSLALLAENTVRKDTMYTDTGKLELSGITFNNWYYNSYGKTDGEVNIVKALQRSNDTYYYKTSLDLGIEKLEAWSRTVGLGAVTGIDVPGEIKGLVPNPQWKKDTIGEQWYPGNTVNMSIGQGDLLATPIQVAVYTSVIANKGTLLVPSIVQKIDDSNGNTVCTRDPESNTWFGEMDMCKKLNESVQKPRQISVNKEIYEAIEEGMIAANSRGGTGTPFFDYPIKNAGKTGTSESIPGQPPHAWFTVYAPLPNPQYVVTILVEHGGEGSAAAAPIAKKIMDYLFM